MGRPRWVGVDSSTTTVRRDGVSGKRSQWYRRTWRIRKFNKKAHTVDAESGGAIDTEFQLHEVWEDGTEKTTTLDPRWKPSNKGKRHDAYACFQGGEISYAFGRTHPRSHRRARALSWRQFQERRGKHYLSAPQGPGSGKGSRGDGYSGPAVAVAW